MKKTIFLLISVFQFINSYSQDYYGQIDSAVASFQLADSDWIIGLTIDDPGAMPLFDSLGNMLSYEDPNGTYIITKINNRCNLHRIYSGYMGVKLSFAFNELNNVSNNIMCFYTKDSIQKVENEWIYPNVYKNDSLDVYNIQTKGSHSPSFRMYFRTKQSTYLSNFDDIDIFIPQRPKSLFQKNLNYNHNVNTFIYRAFINFINFLRTRFKIQILE